ncbi:MAG: hypothetical protein O9972_48380, partial [Burkholderiales bacterium]|nr:hypothetical protein [Burkholderiales bacterium]
MQPEAPSTLTYAKPYRFAKDPDRALRERLEVAELLDAHPDPNGYIKAHREEILALEPVHEARALVRHPRLYRSIPDILANTRKPCTVDGCGQLRYFTKTYCARHGRRDDAYGDPVRTSVRVSKEIEKEIRRFLAANVEHAAVVQSAGAVNAWLRDPYAGLGKKKSTKALDKYFRHVRTANLKPSDVLVAITGRLVHALRHEVAQDPLYQIDGSWTRYGATEIGKALLGILPYGNGILRTGFLKRNIAKAVPPLVCIACQRIAQGVEAERKAEKLALKAPEK